MTEPDFLAALDAEGARRGPECSVKTLLSSIDPELARQVQAAIDGPYTAAAISRQLFKMGHRINEATVNRHRRQTCRCVR